MKNLLKTLLILCTTIITTSDLPQNPEYKTRRTGKGNIAKNMKSYLFIRTISEEKYDKKTKAAQERYNGTAIVSKTSKSTPVNNRIVPGSPEYKKAKENNRI
ncbi:MAG: hypothetical protein ACXWL5_00530 [Candidatus Chromulinivorax sp.]